jgi:hypothetical protein
MRVIGWFALYFALTVEAVEARLGPNDAPWLLPTAILVTVAFGVLIGRWWATALPIVVPFGAFLQHDYDLSTEGNFVLALIYTVPPLVLLAALGVGMRRLWELGRGEHV